MSDTQRDIIADFRRDLDRQPFDKKGNAQLVELQTRMDTDKEARDLLVLHATRMIFKIANKMVQIGHLLREDWLDAVQEAHLAVMEKGIRGWSPNRGAYSTYMWTICRNAILDYNRQETAGGLTGEHADEQIFASIYGEYADEHSTPYAVTDHEGINHTLPVRELVLWTDLMAVDLLRRERFVLDQYFYNDWTLEEIAESLGVSRPFVSRLKRDALDKVAEVFVSDL